MDKDAQKLLVSFYTMRNILRDGGAQDLMALQSINFSAGSGGAVTVPHQVSGRARALLLSILVAA